MSTPTTETLNQRVIELAANQVDIPKEQVSLDSHFVADLAYDSLDKVEFTMTVEEEFDIVVPDETVDMINTVQDVVQLIQDSIS